MQGQLEEPTFRTGNTERQLRSCREGDEDRDPRVDQDGFWGESVRERNRIRGLSYFKRGGLTSVASTYVPFWPVVTVEPNTLVSRWERRDLITIAEEIPDIVRELVFNWN